MTQEEKFEEAKRLYETANADQRYVLESLFPELRESEDERIIGIIKSTLKSYNRGIIFYSLNTKDYADCLAWLEKQAQKAWTEEDKKMLKWVTGYLENKMLNAPMGEERTACKMLLLGLKNWKVSRSLNLELVIQLNASMMIDSLQSKALI